MKPARGVTEAIYAEQVSTLFRQMPTALGVNILNAVLTTIVLTPLSDRPVLPWLAAMALLTMGRWLVWKRSRRSPISPGNARRRAQLATGGALLTGLCWGIGGAVLFSGLTPLGKIFITTVIGGMCAGAVAINASHLPTLVAFVASASLPLAIVFLADSSTPYNALGTMAIVFAVAVTSAGRRSNQMFAEALRLRFERDEANRRLEAEMADHPRPRRR